MKLTIVPKGKATVIQFSGALNRSPPARIVNQLRKVIRPGCELVLDFSGVTKVSGSGLRLMVVLARSIHSVGGTVKGIGVPPEMMEAAEAAGFVDLFEPRRMNLLQAPERLATVAIPRVDAYPTHWQSGFALRRGLPLPFGASIVPRGINFSLYSRHAHHCSLVLYEQGEEQAYGEIPFPPEFRVGDVFSMIVFDLDPDRIEYGFRVAGPYQPELGHRFDPTAVLLDPHARALGGLEVWQMCRANRRSVARIRSRIAPDDFDWEGDRQLELPIEELIIYEMHVRGFTQSATSGVRAPGTFAGIREKIPYLKQLGVNCIELMPIFEFNECENERTNPLTGEKLVNYWGYSTVGFFAPKAGYAVTGKAGLQADEFKTLVKQLHSNGIEIILDVVFNHTAEGNEQGPTLSFRGIDNKTYYLLAPDGSYLNFSGCGNTLNCNHPVVRDFVRTCLRYWVSEFHVDGFRFDLASILGRDVDGNPLPNPPLLESLAMDPILAKTKLIAEAWDAGGLYQVGSFPDYGRWAEWNGRFRDCVRRFLKGDTEQVPEMVQRISGSPDLYHGRGPTASINFITCHDGFTLADLFSYNEKHNLANGENNQDGSNENYSWNCGAEGPTSDPAILALRRRQMKNAMVILLLSQGVPMFCMGDEIGRTQQGNNNPYCHDSPLSWFDWTLIETNAEMLRFCRLLIEFRKRHAALRQPRHMGSSDLPVHHEIEWHGVKVEQPDWSPASRSLAFTLRHQVPGEQEWEMYAVMNMYWEALNFQLPPPPPGTSWRRVIDTSAASPDDIAPAGQEARLTSHRTLRVPDRTVIVLRAL